MEPVFSLSVGFFALAACVQLAFGTVLLVRKGRDELAWVLGALFLFNGGLAAASTYAGAFPSNDQIQQGTGFVAWALDPLTGLLLLYLGLTYPRPVGWLRDRMHVGRAGVVTLCAAYLLLLVPLLRSLVPGSWADGRSLQQIVDDGHLMGYLWRQLFIVLIPETAWIVVLVRWSRAAMQEHSPVSRTHQVLMFAAFGTRAAFWAAGAVPVLYYGLPTTLASGAYSLAYLPQDIMHLLKLSALAAAVFFVLRGTHYADAAQMRAGRMVLLALGIGTLLYMLYWAGAGSAAGPGQDPFRYLDLYVLRPAFVYWAVVRHAFLGGLARRPSTVQVAAGGMAAILTFFVFITVAQARGEAAGRDGYTDVELAVSLILAILAAVGIPALLRPFLRSDPNQGVGPQRIESYVLALEEAHRAGPPSPTQEQDLAQLRDRLGITLDQDEALRTAVRTGWASKLNRTWRMGDTVLGRYVVDKPLGHGALGETYLARDVLADEMVVLKRTRRVQAESLRELAREADTMQRIDNPRVLKLLRRELVGDEIILVLEYAPGGSLASRLERGRVPPGEAAAIARDVLEGLHAAHQVGLVHRDVKPSNILFGADGRAKLADWGIAQPVDSGPRLGDPTVTVHPGSVRYMSPEQVRGRALDPRSDVYSVAVLMTQMLTGSHPVPDSASDLEARTMIAKGIQPTLPSSVPDAMRRAIQQGIHPDPDRRWPTAQAFGRALVVTTRGTAVGSARPG